MRDSVSLTVAALVLATSGQGPACASEASAIDTRAFRQLARSAAGRECVDEQVLYVVDDTYVVRWFQGRCIDAGGGIALFGARPDDVLCGAGQTIAGFVSGCEKPSALPLFESVLEHLRGDRSDTLPGHSVHLLRWRPWWRFW